MAVDPYIARGVQPIDISQTLAQVAALKQRDQSLAQDQQMQSLYQQRFDYGRQQDARLQQQEEEQDRLWNAALDAGDLEAAMRIDPQETRVFLEGQKMLQPAAPEFKAVGNSLLEMPTTAGADPRVAFTAPKEAPQYAPETFSPFTQADGTVVLLGSRGTQRPTSLKGQTKGAAGGVTVGPDGELVVNPDPSKATEGERVSANYLGRMARAESLLGDYQPNVKDYVAARQVMAGGAVASTLANKVLSNEGQKYYQAAADWVRAKLRKESGAVITPAEMEQEIKTYFPLPNDGPEVIEQKRQARLQAQEGMKGMGGRAVTAPSQPAKSNRRVRFEDL
jgi:hypothetical protein